VSNLLWTVIVVLFVLWLFGFISHFGGSLINLLLVLIVIGVIYNLMTGRRAAGWETSTLADRAKYSAEVMETVGIHTV
jgi:hypothetical protein